ncbi:MAG: acetyl-CoA carboxylase carboxyltransferase subunit alpha [Chitinophagales bacterium]|jgi:acetyl-CoA carboxylase carboxyl transferase subunit alpha|nr:acetyl-CoA carboxylase carboxyltransferase subunit alpha [Chitinophagales bacterium]
MSTDQNNEFVYLDFEAPIKEICEQIQDVIKIADKTQVDMSEQIKSLEDKLIKTKKQITDQLNPWQRVQLSRHPNRPYTLFYIEKISNESQEIFGDRNIHDDKAIVCFLTKIEGQSIMMIGHQKGINTKMRQFRNFGMPNPEGYRKALRAMKLAEKFNIPIVTLIDTPGAFPGIEAEERGQAEAIARNLFEMINLKVPIINYIIGEGASGGALGIGLGDKTYMLENTWYTVISPESCSSILWRSWEHKEKAAEQLKLTAKDNFDNKIIDGILEEPCGGAHYEPDVMAHTLKNHILDQIAQLKKVAAEDRIQNRIEKYNQMSTSIEL